MPHSVASWEGSGLRADRTNFGIVVTASRQYQELSPFIREVGVLVLVLLSSCSGDGHQVGGDYIVGGVAVSRIWFLFLFWIPFSFAVTEYCFFFVIVFVVLLCLIKMFLRDDSGGGWFRQHGTVVLVRVPDSVTRWRKM